MPRQRTKINKRKRRSGNGGSGSGSQNPTINTTTTTTTTTSNVVQSGSESQRKKPRSMVSRKISSRQDQNTTTKSTAMIMPCLNVQSEEYNNPLVLLMHFMAGALGLIVPLVYHAPVNGNQPYFGKKYYPYDRLKNRVAEEATQPWNTFTNLGVWGMGAELRAKIVCPANDFADRVRLMWTASEEAFGHDKGFFGYRKRTEDEKKIHNESFTYLWFHRQQAMIMALIDVSEGKDVNWVYHNESWDMNTFMKQFIIYCHQRIEAASNGTDDYGSDYGYSNLSVMAIKPVSRHQIDEFKQEKGVDDNIGLREEMVPYNNPLNMRKTKNMFNKEGGCMVKEDAIQDLGEYDDETDGVVIEKERKRYKNLLKKRNDQVVKYYKYLLYLIETNFNTDTLKEWGYFFMHHNGNKISHKIANERFGVAQQIPDVPEHICPRVVPDKGVITYFSRDLKWFVTHLYGMDGHKELIDEPDLRDAYIEKQKNDIKNTRELFLKRVHDSDIYRNQNNYKPTNYLPEDPFVQMAHQIFNYVSNKN